MARKKSVIDLIIDFCFDILPAFGSFYIVCLIIFWFSDRVNFLRWAIYGVVFLVIFFAIINWEKKKRIKKGKRWLSDREFLYKLRGMSPSEFEKYIADLFSKLGYKTQTVGGSYDKGIDVIAEKDGIKHYVQCKKFITRKVAIGAIRDFYGAIAGHLANGKGYFITTNKFTLEAEKFAEDKPIELIDGFKLIEYISLAEKKVTDSKVKLCPKCGGKLEQKIGKYGKFYGCSNYPKCKYTENI